MTQTVELDLPEGFAVKSLPRAAVDIPEGFEVKEPGTPAPIPPLPAEHPFAQALHQQESSWETGMASVRGGVDRMGRYSVEKAKAFGVPEHVASRPETVEAYRKNTGLYQGVTAVSRPPGQGRSEAKSVMSEAADAVDAMVNMLDIEEKAGFVGKAGRALANYPEYKAFKAAVDQIDVDDLTRRLDAAGRSPILQDRVEAAQAKRVLTALKDAAAPGFVSAGGSFINTVLMGLPEAASQLATGEGFTPEERAGQKMGAHVGALAAWLVPWGRVARTSKVAQAVTAPIRLQQRFFEAGAAPVRAALEPLAARITGVLGKRLAGRGAGALAEIPAMQAGQVGAALLPTADVLLSDDPVGNYTRGLAGSAKPSVEGIIMAVAFGAIRKPLAERRAAVQRELADRFQVRLDNAAVDTILADAEKVAPELETAYEPARREAIRPGLEAVADRTVEGMRPIKPPEGPQAAPSATIAPGVAPEGGQTGAELTQAIEGYRGAVAAYETARTSDDPGALDRAIPVLQAARAELAKTPAGQKFLRQSAQAQLNQDLANLASDASTEAGTELMPGKATFPTPSPPPAAEGGKGTVPEGAVSGKYNARGEIKGFIVKKPDGSTAEFPIDPRRSMDSEREQKQRATEFAAQKWGQSAAKPAEGGKEAEAGQAQRPPSEGGTEGTAEAGHGEEQAAGVKNAWVEEVLKEVGQPAASHGPRRTDVSVAEEAAAEFKADPFVGKKLVDSVLADPAGRSLTLKEEGILLHESARLVGERQRAEAAHDAAIKSGDVDAQREAAGQAAQAALDFGRWSDAATMGGTHVAQSLAFRRRMMSLDFSLAAMERQATIAKGKALTPGESAEVKALQSKIAGLLANQADLETKGKALAKKAEAWEWKQRQTAVNLAVAKAMKTITAERATRTGVDVAKPEYGSRNRLVTKERADAVRTQLRDAVSRMNVGIDPTLAKPLVELGVYHIEAGLREFGSWARQMVKELGEKIAPHLRDTWRIAKQQYDDAAKATPRGMTEESRQKSLRTRTTNRIADLENRLRTADYTKPERKPIARTVEQQALDYKLETVMRQWAERRQKWIQANQTVPQKILRYGGELLQLPRSFMTSMDLSATLRQGGFITLGHPILGAKMVKVQLRALTSEKAAFQIEEQIRRGPNYAKKIAAGLDFTGHGTTLASMEEAFMSRWAEKVPGVKQSQRAYTTGLNWLRDTMSDRMIRGLSRTGEATPAELKAICKFVNIATGRGNFGKPGTASFLNSFLFAPRYFASRLQLMMGTPLWRGSWRTRQIVLKEYGRFLAGVAAVYALGMAAGGTVESDRRSSDFGKIRFGDSRIDPLTGLSQITVFASRMQTGETKNARGEIVPIRGEVPFGHRDTADVIGAFARSKLAPIPALGYNLFTGKDYIGRPITAGGTAFNMVPISMQDMIQTVQQEGVPKGMALGVVSILGMGVQSYQEQQTKVRSSSSKSPFGSPSGKFPGGKAPGGKAP